MQGDYTSTSEAHKHNVTASEDGSCVPFSAPLSSNPCLTAGTREYKICFFHVRVVSQPEDRRRLRFSTLKMALQALASHIKTAKLFSKRGID